jgi:hypothetical protein
MKNECKDCHYYKTEQCPYVNKQTTGQGLPCKKFISKIDKKKFDDLNELHNDIYQVIMDCVGDHENMEIIVDKIKNKAIDFSNKQKLIDKKMSAKIISFIINKFHERSPHGIIVDNFFEDTFNFFILQGLAVKEETTLDKIVKIEEQVVNSSEASVPIETVKELLRLALKAVTERR